MNNSFFQFVFLFPKVKRWCDFPLELNNKNDMKLRWNSTGESYTNHEAQRILQMKKKVQQNEQQKETAKKRK